MLCTLGHNAYVSGKGFFLPLLHICVIYTCIVPSAALTSVQLDAQSSSSLFLSWKLPLPEQQNGRLVYYHIIVTETQVLYLDNGI